MLASPPDPMRILKLLLASMPAVIRFKLASPPDPMRILKPANGGSGGAGCGTCITTRSDEDTETRRIVTSRVVRLDLHHHPIR